MKLSCEQEALRSVFTKKWLDIAFSENNIDRDRAKKIKQNLNFQNYELKFIAADKLKNKLQDKFFDSIFNNVFYTADCLFIDYCHEVLNCNCNFALWNILKQLCADCGLMLIPFQSICLVCDRHKVPN